MTPLVLFLIGAIIGLGLPDIDSVIRFLTHRSIITHSFIWPFLALWAVKDSSPEAALKGRLFAMGLGTTLSVHFCFDLFPRSWWGMALIHIPYIGRVGALISWLWFAISILACLYLVFRLINRTLEIILVALTSLIAFLLMAETEPFIWPLVTFIIAIVLVNGIDWQKQLKRLRQKT